MPGTECPGKKTDGCPALIHCFRHRRIRVQNHFDLRVFSGKTRQQLRHPLRRSRVRKRQRENLLLRHFLLLRKKAVHFSQTVKQVRLTGQKYDHRQNSPHICPSPPEKTIVRF